MSVATLGTSAIAVLPIKNVAADKEISFLDIYFSYVIILHNTIYVECYNIAIGEI
jgi:hypothetical protein